MAVKALAIGPTFTGAALKLLNAVHKQTDNYIEWNKLHEGWDEAKCVRAATKHLKSRASSLVFTLTALQDGNYTKIIDPTPPRSRSVSRDCYANAYVFTRRNPGTRLAVGGWFEDTYFSEVEKYDPKTAHYPWEPLSSYHTYNRMFIAHGFVATEENHVIDPTLNQSLDKKNVYVWQIVQDSILKTLSHKDLDGAFGLIEVALSNFKQSQVRLQKPIISYLVTPY